MLFSSWCQGKLEAVVVVSWEGAVLAIEGRSWVDNRDGFRHPRKAGLMNHHHFLEGAKGTPFVSTQPTPTQRVRNHRIRAAVT